MPLKLRKVFLDLIYFLCLLGNIVSDNRKKKLVTGISANSVFVDPLSSNLSYHGLQPLRRELGELDYSFL